MLHRYVTHLMIVIGDIFYCTKHNTSHVSSMIILNTSVTIVDNLLHTKNDIEGVQFKISRSIIS